MASKEYEAFKHDMARRYLMHVKKCASNLAYVRDSLEYERENMIALKGVSYDGEHVKTSGMEHGDDVVAELVQAVSDAEARLREEYAEYNGVISEALAVFAKLECHEKAEEIIGRKYYRRQRISDIANATRYSVPRVKEILHDATVEVFDLMPHEWRYPNHPAL